MKVTSKVDVLKTSAKLQRENTASLQEGSSKPVTIEKATTTEPISEINLTNNTPISGIPSLIDSLIRGLGRYFEIYINNYFLRIPFRFITEILRYGSSRSIQNILTSKKVDKELWISGIKKSLEITAGTAVIDPNRQSDYFARMGTGFLNMLARTGARVGMVALNILNKKQLNYKTLIDEFIGRTLCRIVYLNSENPVIGIGCRTIEQFLINEWVRHLPFMNKILPRLSSNK